jgi:hypothetical protein
MTRPRWRSVEKRGTHGVERAFWVEYRQGRWAVAYRLVGQKGRPVVAEVRVLPAEGDAVVVGEWSGRARSVPVGGLTARGVHALVKLGRDLDALSGSVRDELGRALGTITVPAGSLLHRHGLQLLGFESGRPKPGTKSLPEVHHAKLAAEAAALAERGIRNIPSTLAKRRGMKDSGVMRVRVSRLKDKGYLTGDYKLTKLSKDLLKEVRL